MPLKTVSLIWALGYRSSSVGTSGREAALIFDSTVLCDLGIFDPVSPGVSSLAIGESHVS